MNLKAFLESPKGTKFRQTEWANKVGLTRGYFNQLVHGTKSPSLSIALKIDKVTEGMVSPYDWPEEQPHERDRTHQLSS